jgi:hypothetical protein
MKALKRKTNEEKISMKILNVTEQINDNGLSSLKVIVESGEEVFEFGVKTEQYLDLRKRANIHKHFFHTIRARQKLDQMRKTPKEAGKNAITEAIESFKGVEIDEEDY